MDIKIPSVEGGKRLDDMDLAEYAKSFVSKQRGDNQVDQDVSRCFGFSIGGTRFILGDEHMVELIFNPNYSSLPNAPSYCLGLASVRGNIVPFYGIQGLVNETNSDFDDKAGQYGLMVGEGLNAVLISIDSKPESIVTSRLVDVEGGIAVDPSVELFVEQSYEYENQIWYLINPTILFSLLSAKG